MKFLVLFLLSFQIAFAQDISTTPPLPTEGSEVVTEIPKDEVSPVEAVVNEAEPVTNDPVTEVVPAVEQPKKEKEKTYSSKENRGDSTGTVMVGYQLITSWLPSKFTLSYTHNFNEKWSLEGEYSQASINDPFIGVDLGEIKEWRGTLQARRFVGNSFNFSFGPVYSHFNAKLGTDFVGANASSKFSAENLGVSGGFGNRWQWKNGITFGIDWLRLNIPVFETKVEDKVLKNVPGADDQEEIKDLIRTFNRIPTFVLFGLNIGYTF